MPEKSWSFHYRHPAPRCRLHWWLVKPDNPAMSPPQPPRRTRAPLPPHWQTVESRGAGREKKTTKCSFFTQPPINKLYNPKHNESDTCASITKPLTTKINYCWPQPLLVVNSDKFQLTSCKRTKLKGWQVRNAWVIPLEKLSGQPWADYSRGEKGLVQLILKLCHIEAKPMITIIFMIVIMPLLQ